MRIFILVILLFSLSFCQAQQHAQQKIEVKIKQPNFEWQQGPRILIDNTHNNFHQRTGRFAPFATLTEKDGYQVGDFGKTSKLDDADILVISNAIHEKNVGNWVQPIHSAFNKNEIEEIRHWVYDGGSLLLIADHMPFAGAAKELASAFGFIYYDGFARLDKPRNTGDAFTVSNGRLLESPVTNGLNQIITFTGSSFEKPKDAIGVLKFSKKDYSLLPKEAWKFKKDTESIDISNQYQGALLQYGEGRIAVFGEAAMFTAQQIKRNGTTQKFGFTAPGAEQNKELIRNVLLWLSEDKQPKKAANELQVMPFSSGLYERDMAISPKGNHALYTLADAKQTKRCIVESKKVDGEWSAPEIVSFTGEFHDIEPFFSPDGTKLFFASNRPMDEDLSRKDFNIWTVDITENGFGEPKPLPEIINTKADEFYATVAANGNLYFTAMYENGIGKEDIFVSKFVAGKYQTPVAVSNAVNSETYEFNAYISPNEDLLVFTSYGRTDDLGRGDLYYSKKNTDGQWSKAKHVDTPINSKSLDYCPFIDWNNRLFYFTSERMRTRQEKTNSIEEFYNYSNSPQNGLGDVYYISLDKLFKE